MNRLQKICLAVIWNLGTFAGCVLYRFIIFFLITLITTPLVIKLLEKFIQKNFVK